MKLKSLILVLIEPLYEVRQKLKKRSVDQWRRHWSGMAQRDNIRARNGYCIDGQPISAEQYRSDLIDPVLALLDLNNSHSVLDIGCGTGELLRALEGRVTRIVGTDLSADMIAHYHGPAETVVCQAANQPFGDAEFDRIVMVSVAQYFPSRKYFELVMQSAMRMLRTGGIFLVADVLPVHARYVPHLLRPFALIGWQWWSPYRIYPIHYLERVARRVKADLEIIPRPNNTRVHARFRKHL